MKIRGLQFQGFGLDDATTIEEREISHELASIGDVVIIGLCNGLIDAEEIGFRPVENRQS